MKRWIRYQVRENLPQRKFKPHYSMDRETGAHNYDSRDAESAKEYAQSLGIPAYVIQLTEEMICQY